MGASHPYAAELGLPFEQRPRLQACDRPDPGAQAGLAHPGPAAEAQRAIVETFDPAEVGAQRGPVLDSFGELPDLFDRRSDHELVFDTHGRGVYQLVNLVGMGSERDVLLATVVDELAQHGIGDRSLRELARATGTSHSRLLYHFGSRKGLITAVVGYVEESERALYRELAARVEDPIALIRSLWAHLSAPEMRPWIRLFFESVGLRDQAGSALTDPWLAESEQALRGLGVAYDTEVARMAVATLRGLLIDVVAADDARDATRALECFLLMLAPRLGGGEASS